jgi:hypothetical protein
MAGISFYPPICNVFSMASHLTNHSDLFWGMRMRRRDIVLLAILTFVFSAFALGREDQLTNTGTTPAAQGKVVSGTDRNGNTDVDVEVKHMATPESLTPSQMAYVVWVQPRGQNPQILGVLRVNKDLDGSLKAATPYKDFEVFITAEGTLKPTSPSGMVILKGTVQRD